MISFLVKKFLVRCNPICLFFLLSLLSEEIDTQKFAETDVEACTVYVFSQSLMISGLIFKSLTHLKFVFVYGIKKWSTLILCL